MRKLATNDGMTLVEVLIAMVVMAVGVTALVAGLASGLLAIQRGSQTSVAGTMADQKMETYRQGSFASLGLGVQSASTSVGTDGKTYWVQPTIYWICPVPPASSANQQLTNPAPTCSGTAAVRAVKLITIDVRDTSSSGKLLFSESSTFDASTG